MSLKSLEIKDRFGRNIGLGTKCLFAEYNRNSIIFEGEVMKITNSNLIIWKKGSKGKWKRHVGISDVKNNLVVIDEYSE